MQLPEDVSQAVLCSDVELDPGNITRHLFPKTHPANQSRAHAALKAAFPGMASQN